MTAAMFIAASCFGKKAFQTPQMAWTVVERSDRRGRHRQPYRCECCGLFHIGGMPGAPRDD